MTSDSERGYRKILNASGYLFQLSVQHEVASHFAAQFEVWAAEHPWRDGDTGETGFADLVLRRGRIFLVTECRRVKEGGAWIFLHPPQQTAKHRYRFRALQISREAKGRARAEWTDVRLRPDSREVAFCAIRGGDGERSPIIERWISTLLRSTESLGAQMLDLDRASGRAMRDTILIPVIVTNAKLMVCDYEPASVSLLDGELPADVGQFHEVPWLRFRKTLSTTTPSVWPTDFETLSELSERSVVVVNAERLVETLGAWKFEKYED